MAGVHWASFAAASLLLAVTPGPGVVYIVTRTVADGRGAGFASVLGVACGNALNAVAAALGLAALLSVSRSAFLVLQWAGAAYLVWLGWRTWRSAASPHRSAPPWAPPRPNRRLWADGLIVAVLNPKTALFFGAFLPQFMDVARPALPQALALGAVFVGVAALSDAAYVRLAHTLAPRLARTGPRRRPVGLRMAGATLMALGVLGAASASRRFA